MKRLAPYFLGAGAYISGIGLTICSAWLITMASFHPPLLTLSIAIVGVRFFGISRSVTRYAERLSSHKSVFNNLTRLRVELYEKVTAKPIELIRDVGSGTLVKHLVDDVERAQEYELRIILPQASAVISLLAGAALGAWIRPESLIVTLPVVLILLVLVPRAVLRDCESIARQIELLESEYVLNLSQTGHGLLEAQLYGYLDERFERISAIESKILYEEKKLTRVNQRFQIVFISLMGFSLIALAVVAHVLSTSIPAVQVTMLIFLPLVLFEAIVAWYPNLFTSGKLVMAKVETRKILESHAVERKALVDIPNPISNVQVESVQARWQPGDNFMQPVSFSITRGSTLIIRGRSGTGKSTLALALLGFLEYEGSILLDGVELRDVADLHKHMVGAIQNSHIFNTTVRENLKIAAPDAGEDELRKALSIVELDELIDEMENGLDTILGEFGRALSGGETKRLNVARTLLSPADILILDEPTEHLDPALAARIEKRILDLRRTMIIITHSGWENVMSTLVLER